MADVIESAHLATYADALRFCDRPLPETENQAQFSLQHCVAVALQRGKPQLTDFKEKALQAAEITGLRSRPLATPSL